MSNFETHVRNQFPSVYITFISVIIGFALEDLISITRDQEGLFSLSTQTAITWGEIVQSLVAIVMSWLIYSTYAISRRSVPTILDVLNVLGFSVGLFLLNSTIGSQNLVANNLVGAAYIIIAGTAYYFAVDQLKDEGAEFSQFVKGVQTFKGPLIINCFAAPYYFFLAWLAYQDRLTQSLEISSQISGVLVSIVWLLWAYRIWRVKLFDYARALEA